MRTLSEQVGDAAGLLGLLLALDTLFTAEQGRRLDEERARQGGPRHSRLATIRRITIGLAVVTAASVALLLPLVVDVLKSLGDDAWEPVLGVFALTWLLLLGLLAWQAVLAVRSSRTAGT